MFGKIKSNPSHLFYPLTTDEIKNIESKLGIMFPKLLRKFYLEIDYGFIGSEVGNINRFMDPESVLDFRMRQNDFKFYPDIEIYDEFEEDKMIFFEANESVLISIGFGSDNNGKIYYYDEEISKNLEEFLEKLSEDDTFYYKYF